MTTGDREQFSTAIGLSAVVNVALFLGIAWAMAVSQGLFPTARNAEAESPQGVQELVILTEQTPPAPVPASAMKFPEPPPVPSKNENAGADGPLKELQRQYVNAPEDAPEQAPGDTQTNIISSRNMRAASRIKGNSGGLANRPTLRGSRDLPQLDLRDADFISGDAKSPAPPAAGLAMTLPSPGLASLTSQSNNATNSAAKSNPAETPTGNLRESAPLAFRDDSSASAADASPRTTPIPASTPLDPVSSSPQTLAVTRSGGVQIQQRVGRMNGKITTGGADSVDALKTPEAAYAKVIKRTFDSIQQARQVQVKDLIIPGSVVVIYELDTLGRISNVRLANPGVTNAIMQDLSITTIMSARLPPPPMELFQNPTLVVAGNRLRLTFTFHYL